MGLPVWLLLASVLLAQQFVLIHPYSHVAAAVEDTGASAPRAPEGELAAPLCAACLAASALDAAPGAEPVHPGSAPPNAAPADRRLRPAPAAAPSPYRSRAPPALL